MAKRRRKHLPFLHGVPVNLTPADKAMVLDIIGAAAEAIRQYARRTYPGVIGGGMSITITAGMLEYEAKMWASRVETSGYEDGGPEDPVDTAPAFRSRQIGRA